MSPTTDTNPPSNTYLDYTKSGYSLSPTTVSKSTSPTKPSDRPHLQSQRPSWAGPHPPSYSATSGKATMTQRVKVTYSHQGLQPPVFIAGSLGDRPWEPIEMYHTQKDDGEQHFWQEFDLEEGEYQYKFRLGPGDWWVLDETTPIVDDGAGNRNNLLQVNLKSHKNSLINTHVMDQATANIQAPKETHHQAPEPPVPVPAQIYVTDEDSTQHASAPESEHQSAPETFPVQDDDEKKAAIDTHITDDATAPILEPEQSTSKLDASADVPPTEQHLFPHETLQADTTTATSDASALEIQDDDDYEQVSSPLFRHESMTPIHTRQEEDANIIPLFRHESMSPIDAHSPFFSGRSARSNSATSHHSLHSHNSHTSQNFHNYDIEDVNDPTLEKFPCERDGIFAQLQRTGSRVNRDTDPAVEPTPSSPALSSTRSLSAAASPLLAREPTQNLDCIDEDDAEELSPVDAEDHAEDHTEDHAPGLGLEKAVPTPDVNGTDAGPEKKETTSKLSISPSHEPVNRGPLTPPLTPIDESQTGGGPPDGTIDGKAHGSPSRLRKDTSADQDTSRSTSSPSSASAGGKEATSKPASFSTWVSRISGGRAGPLGFAVAVGALAVFYAVVGQSSAAKIHEVVL